MEFLVPQNLDVEDTLIGPITFKQSLYIVGAVGGTVISFFLIPVRPIAFFISSLVFLLAIFLGFIKVNGRSSTYAVNSLLKYITSKKIYIWKKDPVPQKISLGSEDSLPKSLIDIRRGKNNNNSIRTISAKLELGTNYAKK